MIFSKQYSTFQDWINNFKGSESYKDRITREHSKFPDASLSQLRGHPKEKQKLVSKLKVKPVYKRSWYDLTQRELSLREKSLDVLSKVRNSQSLYESSKEIGINPETVVKHTNAFKKVNGKWIAKSQDRISRVMSIYENGKKEWIEIKDSRTASRIGRYNSAVKEFLRTGNKNVLKPFKKPFKDANGKLHYFETNPEKLYQIAESQEEPEFYEIYKI
jgi:DNA-binding CsgD family transcriptional regulator